MGHLWRTVRVFISSTFRDMQAERDHLVRLVFPLLRSQLEPRRIHLVDVDLRWGVTGEQNATQVCRQLIDECRPRFLCMLGERYGYVPPAHAQSITHDEVMYGSLARPEQKPYAFFYLRDPATTASMLERVPGEFAEPPGSPGAARLTALKEEIVAGGWTHRTYRARWDDPHGRLTDLEEFGHAVHDDLLACLQSDAELALRFQCGPLDSLEDGTRGRAERDAAVAGHTRAYHLGSRAAVLSRLEQHASSTQGNPILCLVGAAGSGKSALLASLFARLTDGSRAVQGVVGAHFFGQGAANSGLHALRCIASDLGSESITSDEGPEYEVRLREQFVRVLEAAAQRGPDLVILDGLDELHPADQISRMSWLPRPRNANIRVILSAGPGRALDALRDRAVPPAELLLPTMDAADVKAVAERFMATYGKSLDARQLGILAAKAQAGLPLYLISALEELRTLGGYDELPARIEALPETCRELFRWKLQRLAMDPLFEDEHGRRIGGHLVPLFVSYLAVSGVGLTERELSDLVIRGVAHRVGMQDWALGMDRGGDLAALRRLLQPHLMYRDARLTFSHAEFAAAVQEEYLTDPSVTAGYHGDLAEYFRDRADPARDGTWTGGFERGMERTAWHYLMGCRWESAAEVLVDPAVLKVVHDGNPSEFASHWRTLRELGGISAEYAFTEVSELAARLVVAAREAGTAAGWGHSTQFQEALDALHPYDHHLRRLGDLFHRLEEHSVASTYHSAGNVLAQHRGDEREVGCSFAEMALDKVNLGDPESADSLFKSAERIARKLDDSNLLQAVLVNRSLVAPIMERDVLLREAEMICSARGHELGLGFVLFNRGGLMLMVERRAEEAAAMLRDCKPIFERYQEAAMLARTLELLELAEAAQHPRLRGG